jgi:hypothetical protein
VDNRGLRKITRRFLTSMAVVFVRRQRRNVYFRQARRAILRTVKGPSRRVRKACGKVRAAKSRRESQKGLGDAD